MYQMHFILEKTLHILLTKYMQIGDFIDKIVVKVGHLIILHKMLPNHIVKTA